MSSRRVLRRKVVLPVTVIRRDGQEKQLAHTLDLTEDSARLGGLSSQLEPGEVIELQRGAVKAKFQVFWMGAPGSAMAGQAGIRSMAPGKSVWGIHMPEDEPDVQVNMTIRDVNSPVRKAGEFPGEKRWNTRYECEGSATIKTKTSTYGMHGTVKDISEGGVYVEMTSPLPVNSQVTLSISVEGVWMDAAGIVRTSYPLVGMGVSFQSVVGNNREKLEVVLERLKRKAAGGRPRIEPVMEAQKPTQTDLRLENYPARDLAQACRAFTTQFDSWKSSYTLSELEELKKAIEELQQKLSPAPAHQFMDLLTSDMPQGRA